jgi:hypothetical protein
MEVTEKEVVVGARAPMQLKKTVAPASLGFML